jgi:branched-chain amino acid transport system ATP-binding protein
MTAPLLAIERLVVRYGRITALDGASLHVDPGEVVAIVGPNGAGKTTLLSAIAGIVRPVSGQVLFRGAPTLGQPLERTVRRGIALVPEGRHVFSGLTVHENLRIGAVTRRDRAAAEAEIGRFMEIFPILAERRNEPAGRLSGGEQQMLVIARAMLSDPALLMLDEPSLGLAPRIIDQVYALIADLRGRGVTVLVVEQNADRALQAADRTYVLNAGRVRLSGPSAALRGDPAFEAAYFGLDGGAAA